jgi:hypothetical protein
MMSDVVHGFWLSVFPRLLSSLTAVIESCNAWVCVPLKRHIEVLINSTSGCDIFGNRAITEVIKLKFPQQSSNPIELVPLYKGEM